MDDKGGGMDVEGLVEMRRRLIQLSHAATKGDWAEFSMRVPADPQRDADLVLCACADLLGQQAEEIERLKVRGDGHAETLRGIANMPPEDGDRMRQWARDGLSGYVESTESTLLRLSDDNATLTRQLQEAVEERDRGRELIIWINAMAQGSMERRDWYEVHRLTDSFLTGSKS